MRALPVLAFLVAATPALAADVVLDESGTVAGVSLGMTPDEVAGAVDGVAWYDDGTYERWLTTGGGLQLLYEGGVVAEITAYPTTLDADRFVTLWGGVHTGGHTVAGADHYAQEPTAPRRLVASYPGQRLADPYLFGLPSNADIVGQYEVHHPDGTTLWFTYLEVRFFTSYTTPFDRAIRLQVTMRDTPPTP